MSYAPVEVSKYTQSEAALHVALCLTPPGIEAYDCGPRSVAGPPARLKLIVPATLTTRVSFVCACIATTVPAGMRFSAPYAPFVGSPQRIACCAPFIAGLSVHLMSAADQTTGLSTGADCRKAAHVNAAIDRFRIRPPAPLPKASRYTAATSASRII